MTAITESPVDKPPMATMTTTSTSLISHYRELANQAASRCSREVSNVRGAIQHCVLALRQIHNGSTLNFHSHSSDHRRYRHETEDLIPVHGNASRFRTSISTTDPNL